MSEKVFELSGFPTISIMWRGLVFEPFKAISIIARESEIDFYREFISGLSIKELKENQPEEKELVRNIPIEELSFDIVEKQLETQKPKPTQTPKPKPNTTTAKPKTQTQNKTVKKGG